MLLLSFYVVAPFCPLCVMHNVERDNMIELLGKPTPYAYVHVVWPSQNAYVVCINIKVSPVLFLFFCWIGVPIECVCVCVCSLAHSGSRVWNVWPGHDWCACAHVSARASASGQSLTGGLRRSTCLLACFFFGRVLCDDRSKTRLGCEMYCYVVFFHLWL